MGFFFLFLIVSFFLTLFCLYHISREDIVFLRRNVTLPEIFNLAFLTFLGGFFFSRLFYVLFNFAPGFLNPLVFFLVPYYPGLSFVGGIFGGVFVILYVAKKKKFPTKRLLDFLSLSFLAGLPLGYIGTLFLSGSVQYFFHLFLPVLFFIIFLIAYLFVFPRMLTKELKPGMLGTSILIVVSFILFFINIVQKIDRKTFFLQGEDIVLLLVLIGSLIFFMRQDFYLLKSKK